MRPGQVGAVREIAHHAGRQDGRAPVRIVVLEMRHAVPPQGLEKAAEQPARVADALPGQAWPGPQRRGKAGAHIVLAVGGHGRVHRDHQGLHAGGGHAVQQRIDLALVARQVGLEPCMGRGRHHLLQPDQRGAAHDGRHARLLCGLGQHQIASVGRQRGNAHGRHAEGRAVAAPEQLEGGVALCHAHQRARHEGQLGKGAAVVRQRGVVLHRAADVGMDGARQMAPRQPLEIIERQHLAQAARRPGRGWCSGCGSGGGGGGGGDGVGRHCRPM